MCLINVTLYRVVQLFSLRLMIHKGGGGLVYEFTFFNEEVKCSYEKIYVTFTPLTICSFKPKTSNVKFVVIMYSL